MRKYLWLLALAAILAFSFTGLTSCGGGEIIEITFHAGDGYFSNGLGFKRLYSEADGKIAVPEEPTLERFKFREWNTSANGHGGSVLTANVVHTAATAYFAIWDQDTFIVIDEWDYSGTAPTPVGGSNTWDIEGAKIQAMKDADSGSMLRLHFDATGGRGSDRNGWGIGSIGNGGLDPRQDYMPLNAPSGSAMIYFIDVEADWLLEILANGSGDKLVVSTHSDNGDMLKEVHLLEPKPEYPREVGTRPTSPPLPANGGEANPPDPDAVFIKIIEIDYGTSGDITTGKGHIMGEELQLMKDTVAALDENERIIMRLWTRNTPGAPGDTGRDTTSWTDCGRIGGDYDQGALNISGGPIGADRAHIYDDSQVRHLLGLGRDLFLNPYNGNVITLIEIWVVPYRSIEIMFGATKITDIIVGGRTGNALMIPDNNTGFIFGPTGNSRASYPWFEIELPEGKKLGDYKEIVFDYDIVDAAGTNNRRIALLASTTALGGSALASHFTGGSGQPPETQLGSSNGWLAALQVTVPMLTALANSSIPTGGTTVTLGILTELPAYTVTVTGYDGAVTSLNSALAANKLWFSLYENTDGSTVKVSNIRFIEKD